MTQFPASNAPTEQQKWVRAVERAVLDVEKLAGNVQNRSGNSSSSQQGATGRLQLQVKTLQDQVLALELQGAELVEQGAELEAQGLQLQSTVDYLAGLKTVSANGTTFSSGDIPGDSTFRYSQGAASVTLQVPTGRMLVTVGSGQCTLQPGSATAIADTTFRTSGPNGWGEAPNTQRDSRLFLTSGTYLGSPLITNKVIEDIPKTGDITVTQFFGSWASGGGANAQWSGNYLVVQVLDS